jgi:hypothetical protein
MLQVSRLSAFLDNQLHGVPFLLVQPVVHGARRSGTETPTAATLSYKENRHDDDRHRPDKRTEWAVLHNSSSRRIVSGQLVDFDPAKVLAMSQREHVEVFGAVAIGVHDRELAQRVTLSNAPGLRDTRTIAAAISTGQDAVFLLELWANNVDAHLVPLKSNRTRFMALSVFW